MKDMLLDRAGGLFQATNYANLERADYITVCSPQRTGLLILHLLFDVLKKGLRLRLFAQLGYLAPKWKTAVRMY